MASAEELIEQAQSAHTTALLDAIEAEAEGRVTVLDAVAARRAELEGGVGVGLESVEGGEETTEPAEPAEPPMFEAVSGTTGQEGAPEVEQQTGDVTTTVGLPGSGPESAVTVVSTTVKQTPEEDA